MMSFLKSSLTKLRHEFYIDDEFRLNRIILNKETYMNNTKAKTKKTVKKSKPKAKK